MVKLIVNPFSEKSVTRDRFHKSRCGALINQPIQVSMTGRKMAVQSFSERLINPIMDTQPSLYRGTDCYMEIALEPH